MMDYSIFTNEEEELPGQGIVLKKARAKVQSPGGVLSNTVQPDSSMLPKSRRARLRELQTQAAEIEGAQPDLGALQQMARQQSEQGDMATLNALAAQFAGESFQPLQAQFLKRASAAREPMKIGGGMLTPDGQFVRDPFADRQQQLSRLDRLIGAEQDDITAEDRAAQLRQDRLDKEIRDREDKERDRELRKTLAEMVRAGRSQSGQAGTFSPSGFTPQGQQIVTNSKSGVSYLLQVQPDGTPSYTPYQGPMIPKATFDKEVGGAIDLTASANRADMLINQVEQNPSAFGLRGAAVSATPSALQGYTARAIGLTPQQLEVRSTVLRQAAQEINELYGAALSMGEEARASTFLANANDQPEMILSKLKAARDWARTKTGRYSPGVMNAAGARSGGAPAQPAAGGLTPEELAELQKLRQKHGRSQ